MSVKYFDYLTKYEPVFDKCLGLKNLENSITFYRKSIPQDPNMIGMAVRRLLETSVNYLIDQNHISESYNKKLFEKIDLLERKKVIGKEVRQSFHTIRKIGNQGAHGGTLNVAVAEKILAEFDRALRLILNELHEPVQINKVESDNMTIVTYETFDRKLIYVQSANTESGGYDAYIGLEKIGDASVPDDLEADFTPNSAYLRIYAERRINQYMNTAGVPYTLHWAQLAVNKEKQFFRDHEVHDVLKRSGFKPVPLGQDEHGKPNEWFKIDVDTAKKAIEAVKEGKTSLDLTIQSETTIINFRPEQKEAIKQTKAIFKKGNHMLWNAKMRFGKTLAALQLVKECQFKRVLIMTHRPVVRDGWFDDFSKIFSRSDNYTFGSKNKGEKIQNLVDTNDAFIYFASIQDLRGSKWAGGKQGDKNKEFLAIDWDFIIIDEAHEGNETELANRMKNRLIHNDTKVLELSGTPFNLLDKYDEDNIFTWDYTMEQAAKERWRIENPTKPNPYESLPKVLMYTFDVSNKFNYLDENKAFNFKEFFRVKEDNSEKFAYEEDVKKFLNYISTNDNKNNFPYSTKEFRNQLRHTLWLLPGVKEARALELLLKEHPVFETYNIVNVVRDGDSEEATQSDLQQVRDAIGEDPSQTRTITLTVRKLTTGVNIPEWTGVVFLSNTESPTSYLQAAFRAQTPFNHEKLGIKRNCYVFDFAPDRALKIMSESVGLTSKKGKINSTQQKEKLTHILNFLPILGQEGNSMKTFSVDQMMTKLKKAYAEKAVRTGFEDSSLYNDNLLNLSDVDLTAFQDLKQIVGKAGSKTKKEDFIVVSENGFALEEYDKAAKAEHKKKKERSSEEEAQVKELQARRKQRAAMISILRGVSIRIPMMIYGMNVDIDDDITIDCFINQVDEESWLEFMPKGLTKGKFKEFTKYYDADVFVEAGRIIRRRAKSYDKLDVIERTEKIAELFSSFKNPDKETVLTPWRVVNMQLVKTFGGYSFFDEKFENTTIDGKPANHWVETSETQSIYSNESKILDINAKTGLYPLFAATSLYYKRLWKTSNENAGKVDSQELWQSILRDNIYALAKTPMAKTITERTLAGYRAYDTNVCYIDNIVGTMKTSLEEAKKQIEGAFNQVKFDVVIGNPPYQEEDKNSTTGSASPIYHKFIESSIGLRPKYISLITPSVWYTGGKGLDDFRRVMLDDNHFQEFNSYITANDVFKGVNIRGGVNYFLWNSKYNNKKNGIQSRTYKNGEIIDEGIRPYKLKGVDIFIFENKDYNILTHLVANSNIELNTESEIMLSKYISVRNPFNFSTTFQEFRTKNKDRNILIYGSKNRTGYINRDTITGNVKWLDKWKVITPFANNIGTDLPDDNLNTIVSKPNSICTETYLVVGADLNLNEISSKYLAKYLKTKFVRFLISLAKANQNGTRKTYRFVPLQDFTPNSDIDWSQSIANIDQQLYKKYGLSQDEIDFIEEKVKAME